MRLERLDIRMLAGLEEPVSIRFRPEAINFITGPNASGKSSIVRAVRALLYPDQNPGFCHIRARWQFDERSLECERHGTAVTWFDGAEPAPPPQLPGSESLGAYLISSEDLTRLGSTESHIAVQIRTMLAGGYDLDAVLSEAPLTSPSKPQKLAREFSDLARRNEEKETEYARLNEEISTLAHLQRELEATGDAANRLKACEDALALADAIARRAALENTLIEEFSGGMDRLRGDELTRLDQIEEQVAERRKEMGLTTAALEQAEAKLGKSGDVDPLQLETLQSELADMRDRLAELERQVEQHAAGLEQAQRDRTVAAQRLGSQSPEDHPELTQEALEEFEQRVDRVMAQREKIRALSGELARSHVPQAEAPVPAESLRQARDALGDWLEYCRMSAMEGWLWGGLSAGAALAAWRVLGPQDIDPVPELFLLIVLAAGIPLTLLFRFASRYRMLSRAKSRFVATEVEAPLGWTESEVESRLERLEQELEAATHRSVQQARASDVRERLNSERSGLEQARDRLKDYADSIGLSVEKRLETGFLLWCRHLHDWQQAGRTADRHQHELERMREHQAAVQKQAADLLKTHGMDDPGEIDSRSLARLIHQLAPRMRTNAELHNEVQAHRHRLGELEADIEMLEKRHAGVYEQAGIKPGDRNSLVHRIEQFEEWRNLEQQRRDQSLEVSRLEQKLSSEKALLEKARKQQREDLANLHEELSEQATRRDEINRSIAAINTRHDEVLKRRELETLTRDLEQHRQALGDEMEDHLMSAAGQALIEDVRAAHQADNEPAALGRATRWFERFTRHRYRLSFANGRFEAFDTRAETTRSIGELSTATRAQLLLALRLAWIEQAERNREPLPVFMDEVLTTSDPDRYRLVVESVQEIAAGGRQMFYLTAQSDEATAWAAWAGDGPEPYTIDMAEVRRGQVAPLKLSMPPGESRDRDVPEPGKQSPEEWARKAGIGPINPWLGTGMVGIFHLLHDDLALAARLMRVELSRVGELSGFLDTESESDLLKAEEMAELTRRCNAAALVLDDWRRRHDRPVDAAALSAFGQITDTFMPRVLDLLGEVGGDPRRLVEGLRNGEVARFRSETTEQLEQWLEDSRYLAAEPDAQAITAAEVASRTGLEAETAAQLREWIVSAIEDPLGEEAA